MNNYRNEFHPSIAMPPASHSCPTPWPGIYAQHRPQHPHPNKHGILPPHVLNSAQIQQWVHQNPLCLTVLEYWLGGAPDPSAPSDPHNKTVCINPPSSRDFIIIAVSLGLCGWAFATHLRGHPDNHLRAICPIRYVRSPYLFFTFLLSLIHTPP